MILALLVALLGPGHVERAWDRILSEAPDEAAEELRVLAEAHPSQAAAALWSAASIELERRGRPDVARRLLRRIVERHPDAPDAERARRLLEWLDRQDPSALPERMVAHADVGALRAYLEKHPRAADVAVVALHVAAGEPEDEALHLLGRYERDPRYGEVVSEEASRRRHRDLRALVRRWRLHLAGLGFLGLAALGAWLLLRRRRRT